MRKYILLSVLSVALIAAGCKKEDEKTYDIPTENTTVGDANTGNVVRTQVLKKGVATAEITYNFSNLTYGGQNWKVYFTKKSTAATFGFAYGAKFILDGTGIKPVQTENIVTINYPLGSGPGDELFNGLENLDTVQSIIEGAGMAAELAEIFGLI